MARNTAYFRIGSPFQGTAAQGYSLALLASEQWQRLAEARNCGKVDIDPTEDQPRTFAVLPEWNYGHSDTRLVDWRVLPSYDEEVAVEEARGVLLAELQPLIDKDLAHIQDPSQPALTAQEAARKYELERDRAWLFENRYWQDVRNCFGDGDVGLYRACNAPGVPYKLESNWRLDADRPFTLWLHRAKPHEAQQESWVRFRFGHWALVMRQDREIELVRYKDGKWWENKRWVTYHGTDYDHIDAVEAQIEAIRDNGRLTRDDRAQIDLWEQEIANREARLKGGLSGNDADMARGEIGFYRNSIVELRESKSGLTEAQEAQIAALETSIIAERIPVHFAHSAEGLLQKDVALTVIPQRRGYLTLHLSRGRDYFVHEDKLVTDSGNDETIVAATPLRVDGNGGALWFKVAYVAVERSGYFKTREIAAGLADVGLVTATADSTIMPGTRIDVTVAPLARGARYTVRVAFASDGRYMPFLYRLTVDVPAMPRNRSAEWLEFVSTANPDVLWEVGTDYAKELRGRSVTLTLTFDPETYPALLAWGNKQVQFLEGGAPWFTGVLVGPDSVEKIGGKVKVTYTGYDRWYILRGDRMFMDIIGDGKRVRTYLREVARGAGLFDDEIVTSGAFLQRFLPVGKPGEEALLRPEYGCSRADYMTQVFDDFCYRSDMWFDGLGRLHIEPLGTVTKAIAYHSQTVATGDRYTIREPRYSMDWGDFVNDLTVEGREWHGRKWTARYTDYGSILNRDAVNYVGRQIAAAPYESAHLNNQGLVNLACRWRAQRYCQPYQEIEFVTGFDSTLEVGDRVTCDGVTVEVISISSDSRGADAMRVRVRRV